MRLMDRKLFEYIYIYVWNFAIPFTQMQFWCFKQHKSKTVAIWYDHVISTSNNVITPRNLFKPWAEYLKWCKPDMHQAKKEISHAVQFKEIYQMKRCNDVMSNDAIKYTINTINKCNKVHNDQFIHSWKKLYHKRMFPNKCWKK